MVQFVSDEKEKLIAMLEKLANQAGAEQGVRWENTTLASYLEALAGWLQDCEGYYQNMGRPTPGDPWEIMTDAVQAATIYE